MLTCLLPCIRDAETTISIKFAFWRGSGRGSIYGKLSKNAFFPEKFHDNKIGTFANFIVRNFVVIWEAPTSIATCLLVACCEASHSRLAAEVSLSCTYSFLLSRLPSQPTPHSSSILSWELRNIYHHHPESKKRKSSEANSDSIHPCGRYGRAVKNRKAISTTAILWPVKAVFEKRAATVEVDTLISPAQGIPLGTKR